MPDSEELKKILNIENVDIPDLQTALTHRSYAVEYNIPYDNQRLEFLGDAVLEIILTEFIYKRYSNYAEGEMTKIRSALVQEKTLANLAQSINLGEFLLIGKGEQDSGGASRPSTLADLLEAVIGAIYLGGGLTLATNFVLPLIEKHYPNPEELLLSINPKGKLQEYSQKYFGETPKYSILNVTGPEHQPCYEVEVITGSYVALGVSSSRKLAESAAAEKLINFLTEKDKENGQLST